MSAVASSGVESQAEPLAQWRQVAEVVAYDLTASKNLLDEGFLVQAPAMLRPAMELGATLTILVWSDKLSDWIAGRPVNVQWKNKKGLQTKAIDDCTYGALASFLRLLVEQARASQSESQLVEMIEDLLRVHEGFRRALDTNKYVHKSRDVVMLTRRLLGDFVLQLAPGSKNEQLQAGLLDLRFELLVELDLCLCNQTASRYIELVRLFESVGVALPEAARSELATLSTELVAAGQEFEEALRPH